MAIDRYKLLRGETRGKRGEGITLYIREGMCEEQSVKNDQEQVESIWGKVRDRQQRELCGWGLLCYRPLDQAETGNEAILLHLQEVFAGSHPAGELQPP